MKNIFKYINAAQFIKDFTKIPYNSTFKQKARGLDGNKKPTGFTLEEKICIRDGLRDLQKYFEREFK